MIQKNDLKRYKKPVKMIAVFICMAAASICLSCSNQDSKGAVLLAEPEQAAQPPAAGETEEPDLSKHPMEPAQEEIKSYCYIHICGEVNAPGVYRMEEGSRVYEAVEMAGGYTGQAAKGYLNMAQPLEDGMKLVVPGASELKQEELYGEEPQSSAAGMAKASVKVNINTATKEQLMVLKGIGESRAEDIIRYREMHGKFGKVEDIMKVSGIKEAAFLKIKDDITV